MRLVGVITRVSGGTISKGQRAGDEWQQITIEGMRLFVPDDLQNGYCRGQRVKAEVLHKGDKRIADSDNKPLGYEAEYELLSIEVLPVESL